MTEISGTCTKYLQKSHAENYVEEDWRFDMLYCENFAGESEKAKTGEKLKVTTGPGSGHHGSQVHILVSTTEHRSGANMVNKCVDNNQLDIALSTALQSKFNLVGCEMVRCTGNGHDIQSRQINQDGFLINGHTIDGAQAFITLDDLLRLGGEEGVITVLDPSTPEVSTFIAHPRRVQARTEVEVVDRSPVTTVRNGVLAGATTNRATELVTA